MRSLDSTRARNAGRVLLLLLLLLRRLVLLHMRFLLCL
jgi:hypothetical protein